jgi:membrane fusion protein (multidrug efflux system)
MTLAEMNPLRVEVFLPTASSDRSTWGSDALVSPEQPIGGSHTALVTVVYHVLDAASGPFGVRLKLPNPALKLPAGIRCRIEFRLQATRAE